MERKAFVRKGKIQELDRSFDLKYWQTQPPAVRLAALEEIRREYHRWRYGAEPRFQRVYSIVKR
ncbi:MAG: hypothetical protein FJZ96_00210 [Chloroflexi bacterium]|nr:hypothetical protein [Chloroflexota bacterium]